VTKRHYPYAEDEFDVVDDADRPAAAHRRRRSGWRFVLVLVIVAVVAGLLAYGAVLVVPKLAPDGIAAKIGATTAGTPSSTGAASSTDAQSDGTGTTDDESGSPDAASPDASDDATGGTGKDDSAADEGSDPASDEPTGKDEPTKEDTPSAEPVLSTSVRVLNATRTKGLAATGASTLTSKGWTAVTAANYTGTPVSSSVVYYKADDDKATAKAAAEALGISRVVQVDSLSAPVVAILASDYSG